MSRYCPTCLSEFGDEVGICPTHHEHLLKKRPESVKVLVELFAASNIMEAERIVDILANHHILARESTNAISQLPANDAHFVVCVEKEKIAQAKKLIEQAQKDGVISKDGAFL
jgi:hypothetical protein